MNKINPIILKLNEQLDMPQPAKARFILEIALDMKDYIDLCLKKGMEENEALKIAQEKFVPTQQTLQQLNELHFNFYKRWFSRLSQQIQNRWEKIMLIILILVIGFSTFITISSASFFENSSPFLWPVIFLAVFSIIIAFTKLYTLYIKQDHSPRHLNNWLELLLFLTGMILLVGVFGYFYDLYATNTMALFLDTHLSVILVNSNDFNELIKMFNRWDIRSASLLMISMASFSINLFLWFVINSKIIKTEQQELSVFLD